MKGNMRIVDVMVFVYEFLKINIILRKMINLFHSKINDDTEASAR
jgi:hypothetical protein